MINRISALQDDFPKQEERSEGPQPIGDILAELLAQYQARFPQARVAVVETPATTAL